MPITKEHANLICIELDKLGWHMPDWDRERDIETLIRTYNKDLETWICNLHWTDEQDDALLDFKKVIFNIDLQEIIK